MSYSITLYCDPRRVLLGRRRSPSAVIHRMLRAPCVSACLESLDVLSTLRGDIAMVTEPWDPEVAYSEGYPDKTGPILILWGIVQYHRFS